MIALQSIVVLGFLFVFFASAMVRAQLAMRKRTQTARERALMSSKLASGHATPTR